MIGLVSFALCFLVLAVLFLALPRKRRTKRAAAVFLLVGLIFEVGIANFHSYHLLFGDYEKGRLDLGGENVTVSGAATGESTVAGVANQKGQAVTLEFTDLARPVGTLRLDIKLPEGTDYVDVKIDAKDVTQSASYRSGVADGRIIAGDKRSTYIVLDLSGDVSDLKIRLTPSKDGEFNLSSVTVNEGVPFQFSGLRLSLIVLGGMAIFFLCTAPSMKVTYGENRRALRRTALGLTVVLVLGAIVVTYVSMYDQTGALSTGFQNTRGNQITQEIVDAFRAGQVHLLDTPSKEL